MTSTIGKLVAAGLVSASFVQLAAAETLQGSVTDASGEAPLEGAIVTIEGLNRSTSTGRYGDFRFADVPAGDHVVTVSYIGADPVSQTVSVTGEETELAFRLGDDVRYLDNVLVVGSAAAQAGAINQQRASDAIINVIDSDGLGNFPDTTVADSLQRVPGLSIKTDQGEGRYVSIRGINPDLISASINGVRTPSPEDRRGVLLDGVPSDLLDGIEVQKSLTPNVDADTLGGVINLKTISAFDREGRFVRAKLEGAYNEITEELSPKATLTYSEVFADKLGVALSVNFQDLRIESHNNENGGWDFTDDGLAYMSDAYEMRWYDLTRQRLGFVGNFDWRLNANTDLYLRTLYNNYEDDEIRNVLLFDNMDDVEDGGTITNTSQTYAADETAVEVRNRREVRQIETYAVGGDTAFDGWRFQYEASYAFAEEDDSDNHQAEFVFEDIQDTAVGAGIVDPSLTFDWSNPETPRITGNLLDLIYDPSNYVLNGFEEEAAVNKDTETTLKLDVSRDDFIGTTPVTWKGGVKFRDREKIRDIDLLIYEADDFSIEPYVGRDLVAGWRLPNPMVNWPDGELTRPLRGGDTPGFELDEEGSTFDSLAEDYEINEQILAAYGMGTFDIGALTVVAGVRMEDTQTDLRGVTFTEDLGADEVVYRDVSNDFTHWLPSVNLKYNISDKLIARGAYYAATVRPAFGEYAPYSWFNDDMDELEMGNPDLDPYEADNFDLSIEFYPTSLSVLSAGVFYKSIDNAIYPVTIERPEDDLGNLIPVADFRNLIPASTAHLTDAQLADVEEAVTFINVNESSILGLELNYVQDLGDLSDALEGFLFSGNVTISDSESSIPVDDGSETRDVSFLLNSDLVWNIALGYDRGPWDLRVSANYRSEQIDELDEVGLDRFTDARTIIEASAKYSVNDHLQFYVEGKNLTDEPEYYYFGSPRRLSQYDEFGRTYIVGARFTY